jgi:succinate-semialdehyde dehydrogenase/glutarate-semialdehyde dehydrogenase
MTQVDQVSGLLTDLYVEGMAIPAAAGSRFDVLDPATGTVIALENGKALVDARAEVSYAAEFFLPRGSARLHGVALPSAQLVR